MKLPEYESKYDCYDIGQRLADLKCVVEYQCAEGNSKSEYMRGLANGLLLAWHIIREPYGKEVPYFERKTEMSEENKKFCRQALGLERAEKI